mgnify:CR=1 FL=1
MGGGGGDSRGCGVRFEWGGGGFALGARACVEWSAACSFVWWFVCFFACLFVAFLMSRRGVYIGAPCLRLFVGRVFVCLLACSFFCFFFWVRRVV